MKKFITLAILVFLGRAYDVITTYLYTPDLTMETNILVKFLGAGWTSALIVQFSLSILIVALLYFYYFKFEMPKPTEKQFTLKQYISYLYFREKNSFVKVFYKLPQNKKLLLASTGYTVSMTLIIASFIVGTSTTFLIFSENYRQFYKLGIPVLLYLIILGLAIHFTIQFFKIEYEKYRTDSIIQS